jgi:predicted XRE-type DNA-binding protein
MNEASRKRLEAAGFTVGTPKDLFNLSDEAWELAQARSDLLGAIIARRKEAGLSQAELAERMGVTQARVSRIENGAIGISMDVLLKAYFATGAKWADIGKIVRPQKKKRKPSAKTGGKHA